jgi:hypothetical protein
MGFQQTFPSVIPLLRVARSVWQVTSEKEALTRVLEGLRAQEKAGREREAELQVCYHSGSLRLDSK